MNGCLVVSVFAKSFLLMQDSCQTDCNHLQDRPVSAGYSKFLQDQMKKMPVLSGSPALLLKTLGRWLILLCFLVCLFLFGRSAIFQSYRDGVWIWQGAQCSLLECCLTEISRPRHRTYFPPSHIILTLSWPVLIPSSTFLILSAKRKSS